MPEQTAAAGFSHTPITATLPPKELVEQVRAHVAAGRQQLWEDLAELVSFRSVVSEGDTAEIRTQAATVVRRHLESFGLKVQSLFTADGSEALIGVRPAQPGRPTVLLYSHYDVVPAGPQEDWDSDPYTLSEREGRWYGRGTADCKGNLVMHLGALRALQQFGDGGLGLRVVVEGSEEAGGVGLDTLVASHPEHFAADLILIADTGNVEVGVPTLTTSLRGGGNLDVTVRTLDTAVHSGSFGGAAPDAVAALVRMLDSLRDSNGLCTIAGVDTTQRWQGVQYDAAAFRQDATLRPGTQIMGQLAGQEPVAEIADQIWARPAISIIGFSSTPVEQSVNAVPPVATARLNLRVPPGLNAAETMEKLRAHLVAHAPWGAEVSFAGGDTTEPFATDITGPGISALSQSLALAYGVAETATVGAGGSIPLCTELQQVYPQAEIALFGVEEPLCTIHSPNESVDPNELCTIAVAEALLLLSL